MSQATTTVRTTASYLAEMPKTESLEAAKFRVEVAWEDVRDLTGTEGWQHAVAVGNYFEAAQIHRDRIERQG